MKKIILPAMAFTLVLASCYNDNKEDLYPAAACSTAGVTYSGTVKPIILQNCAIPGCHSGSAPANNMDLSTYPALKAIADDGELLNAINHTGGVEPMPQNAAKLPDCSISQITTWVNAGAPEN